MYGYRYTPTGPVFPLPGFGLGDASAEVIHRRGKQLGNNNPATVELVEQVPDGWVHVELVEFVELTRERFKRAPVASVPDPDPFAGLPQWRMNGKGRRRR